MEYILTSAQMQQADTTTMTQFHMPSAVLMERAALAVVSEIEAAYDCYKKRILIVCGVGNNGGDGLAMARLLFLKGYQVTILFPGNREKCSTEAARQLSIAESYGVSIVTDFPDEEYDIIVDALFGIGLSRPIGGVYFDVIACMNERSGYKVAVDIASGIHADDASVMGIAFRADLTVTFGFAKIGQLLFPGASYTGKLIVADIGIDAYSLPKNETFVKRLTVSDVSLLPMRKSNSNKGSYGKVLIFAGSKNMAGAAYFSAKAAYRMGSGLVKIVTDAANRVILQTLLPEAILSVYEDDTDMDAFVQKELSWADAVVLGPGISTSAQAATMVQAVLANTQVPCVVDADAINLLAMHKEWLRTSKAPLILTPHMGEMSRFLDVAIDEIKKAPISYALETAGEYRLCVILKDARSIIATPEGEAWINTSGNNGMATAGSGDVLTGIIGSLLGQGVAVNEAAPLGAYLHGLAGDYAVRGYLPSENAAAQNSLQCESASSNTKTAAGLGAASFMASDFMDALACILQQ